MFGLDRLAPRFALAGALGLGLGGLSSSAACNACATGAEGCACTEGGACDTGLICLSDTCVDENSGNSSLGSDSSSTDDESASSTSTTSSSDTNADATESNSSDTTSDDSTTSTTNDDSTTSTTNDDSSSDDSTSTGPLLDITTTGSDDGDCNMQGCSKVDMIFAIDGSGSMAEEINALSNSSAFNSIVSALELLNCGDIDYRIGVTNDASPSFITGPGWNGSDPWFDSIDISATEIQSAFSSAAPQVAPSGVGVGCEHVLTNTSQLLISDTTGFLRSDALLVIVLITDVDDYGAYDQASGNNCGIGCSTSGAPVADLYGNFLTLKGDDPAAVSTIVVAGDPTVDGGVNFCAFLVAYRAYKRPAVMN